jgi:two-component system chemotaxis response regulator CheB
MREIKVLVIDDSAVTRQVLTRLISCDPELQVVDTALDAFIAMRKIEKFKPDVITLDLELPRMDGITFLKALMRTTPTPVVVISSMSEKGSRKAIEALEAGAVEVITKPDVSSPDKLAVVAQNIQEAIKGAFQAKLRKSNFSIMPSGIFDAAPQKKYPTSASSKIIAIGASTGGTDAIKNILCNLSPSCPGVVIVQHMPEMFTKSFAERLNSLSKIIVREAVENDEIMDGCALIAPGNKHMTITKQGNRFFVQLSAKEKVNRHRPSVDVLFFSVAKTAGSNATGVLLTGMGEDGAAGLLDIKTNGGHTIAQDRASSVVFGMPRRAIEIGAACEVLSLGQIAKYIKTQISAYEK